MRPDRLAAAVALLAALAGPAPAQAADCEALAERAAQREGIPPGLMAAIARVESGRAVAGGGLHAWPWTLNNGGKGSFHATRAAAGAALDALLAGGETNVDIGCMQLNWRWHGQAFADARAMLDPARNTAYAARFLADLHASTGDWDAAVARYHSADAGRGTAYAARVAAATSAAGATEPVSGAPLRSGLLLLPATPLVGPRRATPLFGRRGAADG